MLYPIINGNWYTDELEWQIVNSYFAETEVLKFIGECGITDEIICKLIQLIVPVYAYKETTIIMKDCSNL